jgi:hypothetical protein
MRSSTHITTVHPPFDIRIFHKEAKTLARAGYRVTLIAQHDRLEVVEGVRIVPLPKAVNRFDRITRLTWAAFRLALRHRADVFHFHDPEFLLPALILRLFTKANVIYDVHEDVRNDVLTKYWIPEGLRRPVAFLSGAFEKGVTWLLDGVVAVTEDIARSFRRSRVFVVHNYPDVRMLPRAVSPEDENGSGVFVLR